MSESEDLGEYAYTKLSTKVKRGNGTRDQDTTKVTTRHPDPETAVNRHLSAVDALQEMTNTARRTQPEVDQ